LLEEVLEGKGHRNDQLTGQGEIVWVVISFGLKDHLALHGKLNTKNIFHLVNVREFDVYSSALLARQCRRLELLNLFRSSIEGNPLR
jgi:hypothetical protein